MSELMIHTQLLRRSDGEGSNHQHRCCREKNWSKYQGATRQEELKDVQGYAGNNTPGATLGDVMREKLGGLVGGGSAEAEEAQASAEPAPTKTSEAPEAPEADSADAEGTATSTSGD